jgi:hypothetical protein
VISRLARVASAVVLALSTGVVDAMPAVMFDAQTAKDIVVASEHELFASADGGLLWEPLSIDAADAAIIGVDFVDVKNGFVATNTPAGLAVAKTSDGGATWETTDVSPERFPGVHLRFLDQANGWLVAQRLTSSSFSEGDLYRTTDGGETWTYLGPAPMGEPAVFLSPQDGWMVGGPRKLIFRSRDGGSSWTKEDIFEDVAALRAIYGPEVSTDKGELVMAFRYGGPESWLANYSSAAEGNAWTLRQVIAVPNRQVLPVALIDAQSVYVATGNDLSSDQAVLSVQSVAPESFWQLVGAGSQGVSGAAFLRFSPDGGQTWVRRDLPATISSVTAPIRPEGVEILKQQGFDTCAAPSTASLQTWWYNSPYYAVNLYFGGENRGCASHNEATITSSYLESISSQGWKIIPTWVGLQGRDSSCGSCSEMSSNSSTAYSQGRSEADDAADKAISLGMSDTVIYYDLEAFSSSTTAINAAKSFISGWVSRLHERGMTAGVYGSSCGSNLSSFVSSNPPPDAIWIASWIRDSYDSNVGVFGISCLDDSVWRNDQRLRQYTGGHVETYGGVALNIDSDAISGPVEDYNPSAGLPPPQLRSPADNFASGSTTVDFDWDTVSGATTYRLLISRNASFSGWDEASKSCLDSSCITGTTSSSSGRANFSTTGVSWYWKVRAGNATAGGDWSGSRSLHILPAVPDDLSPGMTSSPGPILSSANVNFSWDGSDGATYYGLAVRNLDTGALDVDTTVSGTSDTFRLTQGASYRWDVRACNSHGCSNFADNHYFQIQGPTYRLSVNASGASGVAISASPSTYAGTTDYSKSGISAGTSLTLTAPSTRGSAEFVSWSGCSSTSGRTCSVTMNADHTVTANYQTPVYRLSVNASGASGVAISASPSTYAGTTDYSKSGISAGTSLTLTAPSTRGSAEFVSWSGCSSTSGRTCSVTMNADHTVTANYQTPVYRLSVNASGVSGVAISASPSTYAGTTDYSKSGISAGTSLTLTAPSTRGSAEFVSWSGCASTSGRSCNVTMNADRTVTANYATGPTYRLSVNASGASGVAIAASPSTYAGTTDYSEPGIAAGTALTLTAPSMKSGAEFDAWSGCDSASGRSCNVTMNADRTVTANYATSPTYRLSVNASGASGVAIAASPSTYAGTTDYSEPGIAAGTALTLTAPSMKSGAEFDAWSGCDSASGRSCDITISRDRTVTAQYSSGPVDPYGWLAPASDEVMVGEAFTLNVLVDSHGARLGAHSFTVSFDPALMQVDTSRGGDAVVAGADGMSTVLANPDNAAGTLIITGFDPDGIDAGSALDLVQIHMLAGEQPGSGVVGLVINDLTPPDSGTTIGRHAVGATVEIVDFLCGDANADGQTNIVDALWVARHATGLQPEPFQAAAADGNGDGVVNIVDALMIARFATQLPAYGGCLEALQQQAPSLLYVPATLNATPGAGGALRLDPASLALDPGDSAVLDLLVDSGDQPIAAYDIRLAFDPSVVRIDVDAGGDHGVEPGADALSTNLVNLDNTAGSLLLTGFDTSGSGPGAQLHLLRIHLTALAPGVTDVALDLRVLTDPLGIPVGTPSGTGARISVGQQPVALSLAAQPVDGGSVSGAGSYAPGTNAPIGAEPAHGYRFERWDGEGVSDPSEASTTVAMSQARSLTAVFVLEDEDGFCGLCLPNPGGWRSIIMGADRPLMHRGPLID